MTADVPRGTSTSPFRPEINRRIVEYPLCSVQGERRRAWANRIVLDPLRGLPIPQPKRFGGLNFDPQYEQLVADVERGIEDGWDPSLTEVLEAVVSARVVQFLVEATKTPGWANRVRTPPDDRTYEH